MSPLPPIAPPSDPLELGITGAELFEATRAAAYADAENDDAWRRFIGALSTLLDPAAAVCRSVDGKERWTQLADPWRCPPEWLRVLAQWAGIRRPDAMTEEELRELIATGGPGFWRGTTTNMIAAVRRLLPYGTAEQFLYFEERADGFPYRLRVFTYTFVEHDEQQVRAALFAVKPAGLVLDYQVRRGQSWAMLRDRVTVDGQLARLYTWADVNTSYSSWKVVWIDEPVAIEPSEEDA